MKFLMISVSFLIFACQPDAETPVKNEITPAKSAEWKTLARGNYEIRYPDDWTVNTQGMNNTQFYLFSGRTDSTDQFGENINLITQDLSNYNMTMDQYITASVSQLRQMIKDVQITRNMGDKSVRPERHVLMFNGTQNGKKLTFEQIIMMREQTVYVLTFTAESSQYQTFQPVTDKILSSFRFTDN